MEMRCRKNPLNKLERTWKFPTSNDLSALLVHVKFRSIEETVVLKNINCCRFENIINIILYLENIIFNRRQSLF